MFILVYVILKFYHILLESHRNFYYLTSFVKHSHFLYEDTFFVKPLYLKIHLIIHQNYLIFFLLLLYLYQIHGDSQLPCKFFLHFKSQLDFLNSNNNKQQNFYSYFYHIYQHLLLKIVLILVVMIIIILLIQLFIIILRIEQFIDEEDLSIWLIVIIIMIFQMLDVMQIARNLNQIYYYKNLSFVYPVLLFNQFIIIIKIVYHFHQINYQNCWRSIYHILQIWNFIIIIIIIFIVRMD